MTLASNPPRSTSRRASSVTLRGCLLALSTIILFFCPKGARVSVNIAARNRYIEQQAARLNLDPKAVAAIEHHEGGSGAIGDNGTSFGPFQLHEGGALPKQAGTGAHAQAWAWSNAGISYALQEMAKVAGGKTGKAAVTAISTRFERPADPAAEISDAMSVYGQEPGGGNVKGLLPGGSGFGGGKGVASGGGIAFDAHTYKAQAAAALMQNALSEASGQTQVDPTTGQPLPPIDQQLEALRQANTVKNGGGAGPGGMGHGALDISDKGSSTGAKAAAMAMRQIGAPYVWGGENAKGAAGGAGAGFDCSGLVQWAYGALGIKLPRLAADQGKMGQPVKYTGKGGNLKPGDLLVENNGDHIVMYAGNGKVVQAPHTGTNVQLSPLSWFPPDQFNARRIAG